MPIKLSSFIKITRLQNGFRGIGPLHLLRPRNLPGGDNQYKDDLCLTEVQIGNLLTIGIFEIEIKKATIQVPKVKLTFHEKLENQKHKLLTVN